MVRVSRWRLLKHILTTQLKCNSLQVITPSVQTSSMSGANLPRMGRRASETCQIPMSYAGRRVVEIFYVKFRCFTASCREEIHINPYLTDYKRPWNMMISSNICQAWNPRSIKLQQLINLHLLTVHSFDGWVWKSYHCVDRWNVAPAVFWKTNTFIMPLKWYF